MVAGCGNKCVKYFFWLINFLFFILGAAILALAIWMKVDTSMLFKIANSAHVDLSRLSLESVFFILYGIMAVGALLLLLGFLGCCGSACESLCAIGLYFIFVIALFVIKIVAVIMYFVKKEDLKLFLGTMLKDQVVHNYYTDSSMKNLMDSLQNGLRCCGGISCNDYAMKSIPYPPTCYQPCIPNNFSNPPGCGPLFWQAIESNLLIVFVIIIAILVIEAFAMILSCIMCGAVKDKRNQNY